MGNPATQGWGPGWPHCQSSKMKTLARADGFRQPFRAEIIPLMAYLMDQTEKRGYNIRPDWSWGYACRQIRGSSAPSYHSWGLCIDINAPTNPMLSGRPGWSWLKAHGRTDMPSWMPGLWEAHGFRWGGNYASRQDAMHYEFILSPAHAKRIIASLGHSGTSDTPIIAVLTKTLHIGDKGAIVKRVQELLLWYSAKYAHRDVNPGRTDGIFGEQTGKAVLAFKTHIHDLQVAFGGHLTFRAPLDNSVGAVTLGALEFWGSA